MTREKQRRLLKACLSGVISTAVDVVALIALVEALGSHVTLAAFLAASLGGLTNFVVNKYWTFRDPAPLELRQLASYALVSLVTAMFVAASIHVLAVLIGLPYLVAKAIAAVLVFVLWSYPAQARLVFPSPRSDRAGAPGDDPGAHLDPFDDETDAGQHGGFHREALHEQPVVAR